MKKIMFVLFAVLCFSGGAYVSPGVRAKQDLARKNPVELSSDSLSASMDRLHMATERLNRLKR